MLVGVYVSSRLARTSSQFLGIVNRILHAILPVSFRVFRNEPISSIQLRSLDQPLILKYKCVRAPENVILVFQSMGVLLNLSIKLLLLTHCFELPNDPLRFIVDDSTPYFLEALLNFTAS